MFSAIAQPANRCVVNDFVILHAWSVSPLRNYGGHSIMLEFLWAVPPFPILAALISAAFGEILDGLLPPLPQI